MYEAMRTDTVWVFLLTRHLHLNLMSGAVSFPAMTNKSLCAQE